MGVVISGILWQDGLQGGFRAAGRRTCFGRKGSLCENGINRNFVCYTECGMKAYCRFSTCKEFGDILNISQ